MPSPSGQSTSPPTLLQQLQHQQQQQAVQREADRHMSSQLLQQAAATAQLFQSGAFFPPPPSYTTSTSSSSPSSTSPPYHPHPHHPYVAPLSAASANVFRPSLPSGGGGGGDSKGFGGYAGLLSSPHTHSSALLSSAPSSSHSSSSLPFSSSHPPPSSSLYSQAPFASSASSSSSFSSPSLHFSPQGLSSSTSTPYSEPSMSFASSGVSTPNHPSSSSSLLFPQPGGGLSSMPSLSALQQLQMTNPAAFHVLLANNPALQASQRQALQQQQQSGRMTLSDSLSTLSYLSNSSSPYSSFPSTPTTMSALTSLSSSPRFAKAVALESDPFESFGGLMKAGVIGRVKRACGNCKAAKTKCDSERPCRRCSRTGRASSCNDSVHKKRGRKRNVSGGDGGEEGDGGESGDEGDEDDGTGGDDSHDSPSHISHHHAASSHHTHRHAEKKMKGEQQPDTETLKLFLLDVALKISHQLSKWREVHRQQLQREAAAGGTASSSSNALGNALRWFDLLARTDALRKLLYTGKDGVVEDASSTDIDLLLDGPEVAAALESAQKEVEGADTPGYTLPLYPVPYFTSPATFLDPSPHSTHPDAPRAFFNDSFCHLLASSDDQLSRLFSHLPSFLQLVHHTHLDAAIAGFVDAICSCRPSLTLSGARYSDAEHRHTFDCIEAISIHSVRGVPVALAICLHSIVSVDEGHTGAEGGRRLLPDDERMAKLADGDSEDEGDEVVQLEAPPPLSTAAGTTAGETTGGESDASPMAQALGAVQIASPKPTPTLSLDKRTAAE